MLNIRKKTRLLIISLIFANANGYGLNLKPTDTVIPGDSIIPTQSLTQDAIAKQLGWISITQLNRCGGYYNEEPFIYSEDSAQKNLIEITSGPAIFAQHGTSILQGDIKINQYGQEVKAEKAYLYRDPITGKISAIDLFGHVRAREPESLMLANKAHLDLRNKRQKLNDIYYRTTIYSSGAKPARPTNHELQHTREITQLSAWGEANEFRKDDPKIFKFTDVSYTTCPPNSSLWKVKAKYIELNKNTGRGVAYHGRLYIKSIPILYAPYLNFPIDDRRQTGFLFPTLGSSNRYGPYLQTPFYWNLAPNYDMTITPLIMAKRTLQLNDLFRYLTPFSDGQLRLSVIPNDPAFKNFQGIAENLYQNDPSPITQANLRRLENASSVRGSISWQHQARFNENWAATVDYNRVTDDYYLRDFGSSITETTANQLLQEANLRYEDTHWDFLTRLQQYQTLHPVDILAGTQNQYSRFPQLVLNGNYVQEPTGFTYTIANELTNFGVRPTPGFATSTFPLGQRAHTQPSISYPFTLPYLFITPRIQLALTKYALRNISNLMPSSTSRAIPIFDLSTGLFFDRNITLFNHGIRQTLEPQLYYLYVPYRNQLRFPVMDTTANTLTYNQMFVYNRFSGLDRFGDANQVSLGITTRFLDDDSGFERIRTGLAQIIYFRDRLVTICTIDNPNCLDPNTNRSNRSKRSPITGFLTYQFDPQWSINGNTIWNYQLNMMDNQDITVQYHPDPNHVFNFGYNFVRNGDVQPNVPVDSSENNLKQFDFSFAWPIANNWSAIGRWTKSVNRGHFQNLIYGLQYDSCCWAARFVGGKTFTNLDPANNPQYNNQVYFQFALRGLGNFGSGDPSQYISSNVTGYNTNFGQDF